MKKEEKIFIAYESECDTDKDERGEYDFLRSFNPHCFETSRDLMKFTMASVINADGQLIRSLESVLSDVLDVYCYEDIELDDDIEFDDEFLLLGIMEKFCKSKRSEIKLYLKDLEADS